MMRIGSTEIILLLILALVIFGGGKIAGVGKALGTSIRDFKKEVGSPDEVKAVEAPPVEPVVTTAEVKKEDDTTNA